MRIERTLDVAAGADAVHALMSSPDFQQRKADAVGAVACDVEVREDDDALVVSVSRHVPAGKVPEFIKAMVEPTLVVKEVEVWGPRDATGAREGTFDIDVSGAPIKVRGSVAIQVRSNGSSLTFAGDLTTSVPLFRQAIERAASTQVLTTIEAEFDLIRNELAAATDARADERIAP